GVNKYRVEADEAIEVLRVDNADVLAQQKAKLEQLRAERDSGAVTDALRRLTDAARAAAEGRRGSDLDSNLLKLAVDAARVIATAFADLGFDVDVGPLFQTPEEVARQAVEADVHVVGVSSLAAGHLTLVPALKQALADLGAEDVLIVVGGVIPPDDVPTLKE